MQKTKPSTGSNVAPASRPLSPPRRVFITLASLAAAVVLVRGGLLEPIVGSIVDQAVRNIITLILCFSGLLSLLVWLVRESGYSRNLKQMVLGGLLGGVVVAAGTLRIERVSGDLVPEFNWRWAAPRDRLLSRQNLASAEAAAAWTATDADFPRFLGPSGTCGVDSPVLDPEWQARPPRLVWKRPIGAGWSGFATCGDHAVTLEQRGDEEVITCHAIATGEPEWAVAVPTRHETILGGVGPRSTPTIRDGIVYATGATGWLHAVDGATGRVAWRKNVLDDLGIDPDAHAVAVAWGRAGSPLVTEEMVIVPAGGPRRSPAAGQSPHVSLVAYDRETGARRWTAGDEQIAYASPMLVAFGGREQVVSVNESHAAAYDPADGRMLWMVEWPGHSNSDASCSQLVPLDDRRFFISKGYGIGSAVFEIDAGPSDGQLWPVRPIWQDSKLLKTKFTNVAVHDGHVYGLSDGILECVRLADGRRAWKEGRYGQGQVLRIGGFLLVQAESGEVVLVEASSAKHEVVARLAAINGQTWNNPCIAGRMLLVRNAEEAACYELPVLDPSPEPSLAEAAP
ncbi:MAG: PQQ-binding-like beta-propeller repeat protein [Planctomycetia bacterium]